MNLEQLKYAIENQTSIKVNISPADPFRAEINGEKIYYNGKIFRYIGFATIVNTPKGLVSILRGKRIIKISEEKFLHIVGTLQNITAINSHSKKSHYDKNYDKRQTSH